MACSSFTKLDSAQDQDQAMSMTEKRPKREQQIFTLLVEVGRSAGDDLPKDATGAALMVYSCGVDEAEAVRETVAVLKVAGLSPLAVTSYGTLEERLAEGHDISPEDSAMMQRAEDQAYFVNALNGAFGGQVVPVPGGVLVMDSRERIIGAVGVTGDTSDDDAEAALAGIEAAGLIGAA